MAEVDKAIMNIVYERGEGKYCQLFKQQSNILNFVNLADESISNFYINYVAHKDLVKKSYISIYELFEADLYYWRLLLAQTLCERFNLLSTKYNHRVLT